jgi:hypothetical protein
VFQRNGTGGFPFRPNAAAIHRPSEQQAIRLRQLRRLHALWRRWAGKLALSQDEERQLRHYYIWLTTGYQCADTRSLTEAQAARVIEWLAQRVRRRETRRDYIAGTAGRHGFPEQRQVGPTDAAWRALWGCATALGMNGTNLDDFILRHYAGIGLHGIADLRSMADLNRVLWGLKSALRRRKKTRNCARPQPRAA